MHLRQSPNNNRRRVELIQDPWDKSPDRNTFILVFVLSAIIIYLDVNNLVFLSWIVFIYNILRFVFQSLLNMGKFEIDDKKSQIVYGSDLKWFLPKEAIAELTLDRVDEKCWKLVKPNISQQKGDRNDQGVELIVALLGIVSEIFLYPLRFILQRIRGSAIYYRLNAQMINGELITIAYTRAYERINLDLLTPEIQKMVGIQVLGNSELVQYGYVNYLSQLVK